MSDIVGNGTLRSLWSELVEARGDCTFLIFQDRRGEACTYTYRSFDEEINRTANLFLTLGVKHGERVAVQLHSCPEFMMCLFGLAKIGAIVVPVNEQYLVDEAAFVLEHTGATCAVIEPDFITMYRTLLREKGFFPKGVIVAREALLECQPNRFALGAVRFEAPLQSFDEARAVEPIRLREMRPLSSDDTAEIIFTSGTTSRPKGVVLTHANMLFSGLYGDWETALSPDDRMLSTMPACHSNFQLAALTPVLAAGAVLIVVEKYSASRFWKQVRDYNATVVQCVAMMLRTLMLQPEKPDERDHCLREILYFLTVPEKEKQAFECRFGVELMNTYGSTESICWVLTDPPIGPRRWPSVGRPGLGYEVRIARDDGVQAVPGEMGEIQVGGVRGRSVMKEYFGDPEATARAFTEDGWLRTGDKGYMDEDGWFFFVDRKVDMIKRAGENISASELEGIIMQYPAVEEAAVIGVPDPIRDQAVKAYVKPCVKESLTEDDVLKYCEGHMAKFKIPSYVQIVDDFPRTCSMKIEKRLLR